MGESARIPSSTKNLEVPSVFRSKKASKGCSVVTAPKTFTQKSVKHMDSLYRNKPGLEFAGHIAIFLLKVAALEMVRRLSKDKCPFVWRSLQALQVLCYSPFKWIQRWAPFKSLVMGIQQLSRPLLFLSIATAFSDQAESLEANSDASMDSQSYSEPPARQQVQDTVSERDCDESLEIIVPENWLVQLHKELETQNLTLPERVDEGELRRFYAAANGDFSCLLSSIKRTIRWRETYHILSAQELEAWSDLVFWHGRDVKLRPCLFVRLGLASSNLAFHDRPRFTQAIVSQIEHGVLHLVNVEDPQITVLMDCEGLSPFNFPMQMLRSCSSLVQDHYPNRLGCLFVIRLAPIVRMVAQTFFQVLKPVTRQKLRIEGETYKKVLSEYLQTIPSFLGGDCVCSKCSSPSFEDSGAHHNNENNLMEPSGNFSNDEDLSPVYSYLNNAHLTRDYEEVLKKSIVAILMVLIFVGFLGVMYGPESPFSSS
ncbi:Sec14 cytosolic factor like [Thalictrum thalictroides]|uniref:Sec14 cytosolic factor like n=1 Tax=Thalictrum thalictroides TaxID=46969 RepID=A0A7J6VJG0_THATH|nr:Sec14 cytosolic factor like [Thalictrum thalictroides]